MLAYIRVAPFVASLGKELWLPLDMQLHIAPGSEQHVIEFLRNTGRQLADPRKKPSQIIERTETAESAI
ncbi:hypothetical protein T11_1128 [Trichinella zimbabwensis]|uniref:Uncharacterized protein n=1 Tax=Trichinella zimbabwensis TaxID=268475 RepID=A0A0V1I8A9_9BILA|nr:hypothetical protein T11_1128 [Trichinella zimbabwensis]